MVAGVATEDEMVTVGINLHLELLVGLHISLAHLGAIAEVNIVVGSTVDQQEFAAEFVGTSDGRDGIIVFVLLRSAHKTFGIYSVVIAPVAGGCHRHATTEDGTSFRHRHQRVETAEAPSPDSDAVLVNVGLLTEPDGSLHLVVTLKVAETQIGTLLEVGTARTGSTTVDT